MPRRILVDVAGATCPTKGSRELLAVLRAVVARRGLQDEVAVVGRGCFGLCRLAPNLYIEPDRVWYSKCTVADVEEIVEEHLIHGRIIRRLVHYEAAVSGGRPTACGPEATTTQTRSRVQDARGGGAIQRGPCDLGL